MKIIAAILSLLLAALVTFLSLGGKKRKIAPPPENNLDEEMVGPRGEQIFIGHGGGRYFLKDGKKVFVGYRGKKQHAY